ncbi:MAG: CHRD domain-containing protein [Bacteroidetes bacterium]|nr:CHRD domain-containing protein [Bacteroidota bacterium]MBU1371415.1 CHRD domain-containing protein [Bacteroidota bacterium]MBU1485993.1 CHRD domain-containing protein [Bacteroidota bacterium]MBU1760459.1 CHRD domain-containing protein [Bacteroidota bacterium]MBU2269076.1 CHRD domain-containing protein [Bacteroidota bacterium]
MKLNYLKIGFAISSIALVMFSCKKDNTTPEPTVTRQWTIALSAKNEVPAPANRTETGTATLELRSDNSLKYTISVGNLTSGDALVAAHLHVGNVITNGGIVLALNPTFTGGTATGTITKVRQTLVDSLKSDVIYELYFNVHSSQVGSGLVRGQLNVGIELAADVALSGANEAPNAVNTTAKGLAILRLTADKKLYSKVTITTLEQGDAMAAAHIHKGASGVSGPVILALNNATDFGTAKMFTVDDALFTSLKTDAIYVNAHSANYPGGIVRGQIR